MCSRPGLCHSSMRSGAILPVRRDRRQPGCAVPYSGGTDAEIHLGLDQWPVHLYDIPAGNATCSGEVLWCEFPAEGQYGGCGVARRGVEVCGRAEGMIYVCLLVLFVRFVWWAGNRRFHLSFHAFFFIIECTLLCLYQGDFTTIPNTMSCTYVA